ncbi:C2H2 transcription factor [Colletotrichum karsti]|uniref:C2H2 transcription factor n=1 Tax=Colletotrichum karsti TaxID=1095194 RepID=A0A9P6LIH4_9PEZI|nr:C2H2 transcription factor [Colletotrichum karsti]KAF9877334.1 C2H2 transcription factor [Colletotrichum karsti]
MYGEIEDTKFYDAWPERKISFVSDLPDSPGAHASTWVAINILTRSNDLCSLGLDYSFFHAGMAAPSGMFSFSSQTGPSDHLSGSWETTGEGAQNFQDFSDNGSAHPGESEDFPSFQVEGHITPRGQGQAVEDLQSKWTAPAPATTVAPIGGEPMRRGTSKSSNGSRKQHRISKITSPKARPRMTSSVSSKVSAQLSSMDITGNASVYSTNGPQINGQLMDVNSYFLDSDTSAVSSQWFNSMEIGMPDGLPSQQADMTMHVVPAQMQLDPDSSLGAHSPSASWNSFSPSESQLSSPAQTPEDLWLSAPLMTSPSHSEHVSPIIQSQSPRYVPQVSCSSLEQASDAASMYSVNGKFGPEFMGDELSGSVLTIVGDAALPPAFPSRRNTNEGDSARDHPLYKNAVPQADGLFHCPWEGETSCNHKPEKLKCNYDKFVDSHLKPYRCKIDSCENARFSSTACLLRHEREAHAMHGHGDKPFLCSYEGCDRAMPGNGFPRQWNLKDHMRRVHNDNGAPGSPTNASVGQQSSKSRKRKDAPKAGSAPSSRKVTAKPAVVEVAIKEEEQSSKPLIEEWLSHRQALENIIRDFAQPEDVKNVQLIKDAHSHLAAMGKIGNTLAPFHGNFVQAG